MIKNLLILALISYTVCHTTLSNEELEMPAHNWEIMKKVNSDPNSTWRAGVNNKFKNATMKDVVKLLGSKYISQEEFDDQLPIMVHDINDDLPDTFDLRTQYPQCTSIGHIQDQSSCGSCWANSAAGVMSDRWCIHNNNSNQVKYISVADIMSCCHLCGNGCDGGFPFQAFLYWGYNGVPTGADNGDTATCKPYPFPKCDHHVSGSYGPCPSDEYPTPSCVKSCQNSSGLDYNSDKTRGTGYKLSREEKQIRQDIIKNGSVSASFTVYEDFVQYKSGVYQHHTGKALGGHAVRIVGWGIENTTPYWLVANSWNEDWGDKGYFKIIRGTNDCGFESQICAGNPLGNGLNFLQ